MKLITKLSSLEGGRELNVVRFTCLIIWHSNILLKCSAIGIGFNGAETNCGIAHILGILLMNSCNTDIFFSNYYHLQSVRFEFVNISS